MNLNNVILAALATCMIIVVFATTVTLAQQFIFKTLQSRRIGMIRLLDRLFDGAVAPRLREVNLFDADTFAPDHRKRFALDMTVNQTFRPSRAVKSLSEMRFFRRYFGSRLQRMSTRQFVEHLANTDAGYRFASLDRETLGRVLKEMAYEFERYGEEQWQSFKTKTTVITVVIGIAVAFLFNVDVWRTFNTLLTKPEFSSQIITQIEPLLGARPTGDDDGFVAPDGQAAPADASNGSQADPSQPSPAPENPAPAEAQPVDPAKPQAALATPAADAPAMPADAGGPKALLQVSQSYGLSIGPQGYPYCVDAPRIPPKLKSGEDAGTVMKAMSPAAYDKLSFADDRCGDGLKDANPLSLLAFDGQAPKPGAKPALFAEKPSALKVFWARVTSPAGLGWLISIAFAGALFGLGAPFWFDVFTNLASMATQRNIAQLKKAPEPVTGGRSVAVRPLDCVSEDDLVEAFGTAARSYNLNAPLPAKPVAKA